MALNALLPAAKYTAPAFQWSNTVYRNDRIAHAGEESIKLSEVLEFIFHGRMTPMPKKIHQKKLFTTPFQPGWVHIGKNKEDLLKQRETVFVRTYQTLLDYVAKGYQYMTYATFNVQRRKPNERNRRNINSVHAFAIDIDTKQWSVDDILRFCAEKGLVPPSFINETVRGYHVWFVLEQDIVGPHFNDVGQLTKAGSFYNDVNRFLIEVFEEAFPKVSGGTDKSVIGGERYIRIPDRIVYFSGNKYSITDFIQIRKEIYPLGFKTKEEINKKIARKQSNMFLPKKAIDNDPAWLKLLTMQPSVGDRRRTAFTIALLYYALHIELDRATEYLKNWYHQLDSKTDFSWREIEGCIQCAYSGKFGGPQGKWVFMLTGIKPTVYFTRRKSLEERKNSTQSEWTRKFLELLQEAGGEWTVSNRQLCAALQLTSRAMLESMLHDLCEQGVIERTVSGKGRYAVTTYRLIEIEPEPRPTGGRDNVIAFPVRPLQQDRCELTAGTATHLMTHNRICILKSILGMAGGNSPVLDDDPGG
ncbi:hypothetical protein AV654_19500 [Paenibacillus elgii]|uniref:Primase C-terminal 1 domain-containing protein n=1 Tax=Paenibacillus elgii TaxID=189691 RepID=A0A163XN41_9BACL|nr:hypothetical protein [Paenibacillus elgii]KZE78163.1 hypothetical protein AV654_19500 [Paenibacillus elgii]